MATVDHEAAETGISSKGLMDKAARFVAAAALSDFPWARRFVVLCGPGNNGGDGYVAARALRDSGADVRVYNFGAVERLKGDGAWAYDIWGGGTDGEISDYRPEAGDVVIDGLFGAGLARPLTDNAAKTIERISRADIPVIAIDLPSGVDGRTGKILGTAFRAHRTVTFMARKPGHLLMPGRELCGTVQIADIGIPTRIVEKHADRALGENSPQAWRALLPADSIETHKYKRGHMVVFCGEATKTGAARMSAMAGLKIGAGLLTMAAPQDALSVSAEALTAIMLHEVDNDVMLQGWLSDKRLSTFVLGPGFGIGEKARRFVDVLKERHLVLDADGITSFKDEPRLLFDAFAKGETRLVLTPHEGEFARLFPDIAADEAMGKVDKARAAAARAHAVIVYKGADSVIAAPDGRALINTNAPPWLATAGAGDVLAGMIGGLMAQGVPAFEAAAAGVWLHGDAAMRAGRGLTAEDLVAAVKPYHAI